MIRALFGPWSPNATEVESTPGVRPTLQSLLDRYHGEVWRVVRRLGVPSAALEDIAQQVFVVAASKLGAIEQGRERAFLIGTAVRLSANHRRTAAARREQVEERMEVHASDAPTAEELLDEVLDSLPHDLRTVLVLFELEELRLEDIANMLDIPRGTAASRLRRARATFDVAAKRLRARLSFQEVK